MNKLKQAIAYLVSKIQTAYYATKFLASVIFWEIPHGHHRVVRKDIRDGVCGANSKASNRGVEADGIKLAQPIRAQEEIGSSTETYDEFLGFWAGDLLDRLYGEDDQRSPSPQGSGTNDLQDAPQTGLCLQGVGEWDLLEPCDRQAIILDNMRERQSKTEDYRVFSTHDVVELCDRAAEWETTFEDLICLSERRSVKINVVYNEHLGGKFIGLFWGLR
jgi:hypothetical protein